jgi:hypothetical protein
MLGPIQQQHKIHTAGNNIFTSANTERTTTSTSYQLKKQFTMSSNGNIKISCELKNTTTFQLAGVDYRVNDISVATNSRVNLSYGELSNNLINLKSNDIIKVYLKVGTSGTAYIRNCKIKIAESITLFTSPTVNQD